jgi:hypothetical protein
MKNNAILFTILIFAFSPLYSQEGKVEIIKDQRIESLIKKQSQITPPATSPQMMGYRIQLFFDTDKKSVDQARMKLMNAYPKMDTYLLFNAPNYVLKTGDFRTQLEAEAVKSKINSLFPASFIVKEMINLPRIDQE